MNKSFFIGNLTKDPELHTLENTQVVNFSMVVNRYHKKATGQKIKEKAFIDCEAWDSGAQAIINRFRKGDRIAVECSARTESWVNKDGLKRSRLKFRVEHFYAFNQDETLEPEDNVAA